MCDILPDTPPAYQLDSPNFADDDRVLLPYLPTILDISLFHNLKHVPLTDDEIFKIYNI